MKHKQSTALPSVKRGGSAIAWACMAANGAAMLTIIIDFTADVNNRAEASHYSKMLRILSI